jgi:hypothetical protein
LPQNLIVKFKIKAMEPADEQKEEIPKDQEAKQSKKKERKRKQKQKKAEAAAAAAAAGEGESKEGPTDQNMKGIFSK